MCKFASDFITRACYCSIGGRDSFAKFRFLLDRLDMELAYTGFVSKADRKIVRKMAIIVTA
jgi:hypothetical protein